MKRAVSAAMVTAALCGCASVINETTHPIKVETLTSDGTAVAGADCKMTNDYGTSVVKSGETSQVRRSAKDLDIVCKAANQADAQARAVSRANAGLAGNILIGGLVGAIIDHNKGTAYTYPTWIQLVFGQTLFFDRNLEKEGQPLKGAPTAAAPASQAGDAAAKAAASPLTPGSAAPAAASAPEAAASAGTK